MNGFLENGVMLNAYPDSLGNNLEELLTVLEKKEFHRVFSFFYILPSLFQSDLDRGFSVQSYHLNPRLAQKKDLKKLREMQISLKLDFVLNHLSVQSPQFQDLLQKGDQSEFRDFFIDWNAFWEGKGEPDERGCIIPEDEYLKKLFMRKPGLPVLQVPFPDGTKRFYWNTFYQRVSEGPGGTEYLGQMDLNAASPLVWNFYEETLKKLKKYGAEIVRLDAFAYLHKAPGESNFFNIPGTWEHLEKLKRMADRQELKLLPEIHCSYRELIHKELSDAGYMIYDFFLPGLIIHALEKKETRKLKQWFDEIQNNNYQTVNMLGCHDGIPLLDLRGLISDTEIDELIDLIQKRGGRVKDLYGPDGKKISYYQVNATYYSALGENQNKMLLARAIQVFMPGIPQIWYLDLFGGVNDTKKADKEGHKEINRTDLSLKEVDQKLQTPLVRKQLSLLKFRNTFSAFTSESRIDFIEREEPYILMIRWENADATARLEADIKKNRFRIFLQAAQEKERELRL